MKKTNYKPAVVPTVLSQKSTLWSLVLIALFGALMWLYLSWSALAGARERLAEPVASSVSTEYFTVDIPPGWQEYSVDGPSIAIWRDRGGELPILHFLAERDEGFSYHALDTNPAIVLRAIDEDIESENIPMLPKTLSLVSRGMGVFTVKPGISAVRVLFDFDTAPFCGAAVVFYSGDVRYVIWSVWPEDDGKVASEIRSYLDGLFDALQIPEFRESIDRPVVDSGKLTAELNERTHLQIGREMALWKLFSARAEAEPDAALLPALKHYREALRLLSTIRQERLALASDDFALYGSLLEKRRRAVDEWFVVLDKAVAMQDWKRAREQAQWIMSHATLTGERADVRRASETLAGIPKDVD